MFHIAMQIVGIIFQTFFRKTAHGQFLDREGPFTKNIMFQMKTNEMRLEEMRMSSRMICMLSDLKSICSVNLKGYRAFSQQVS